jgi:hypothetical protein
VFSGAMTDDMREGRWADEDVLAMNDSIELFNTDNPLTKHV